MKAGIRSTHEIDEKYINLQDFLGGAGRGGGKLNVKKCFGCVDVGL